MTLEEKRDALIAEIQKYAAEQQETINTKRQELQEKNMALADLVRDVQRQIDHKEGRLAATLEMIKGDEPPPVIDVDSTTE